MTSVNSVDVKNGELRAVEECGVQGEGWDPWNLKLADVNHNPSTYTSAY